MKEVCVFRLGWWVVSADTHLYYDLVGYSARCIATVHNDSCLDDSSCWDYSNPNITYRFIFLVTSSFILIFYYIHKHIYTLNKCMILLVTKLGISDLWYGFFRFRRVRKIPKRQLFASCHSVRPNGISRLQLNGYSWSLIFFNIFRIPVEKILSSVKI